MRSVRCASSDRVLLSQGDFTPSHWNWREEGTILKFPVILGRQFDDSKLRGEGSPQVHAGKSVSAFNLSPLVLAVGSLLCPGIQLVAQSPAGSIIPREPPH